MITSSSKGYMYLKMFHSVIIEKLYLSFRLMMCWSLLRIQLNWHRCVIFDFAAKRPFAFLEMCHWLYIIEQVYVIKYTSLRISFLSLSWRVLCGTSFFTLEITKIGELIGLRTARGQQFPLVTWSQENCKAISLSLGCL